VSARRARVVGRGIERVEAIKFGLHLGAIGDGEAYLVQDAAHFLAHERKRMARARAGVGRWQRGIDRGADLRGDFGIGNAAKRVVEQRLELGLGLVDELAERGGAVPWARRPSVS